MDLKIALVAFCTLAVVLLIWRAAVDLTKGGTALSVLGRTGIRVGASASILGVIALIMGVIWLLTSR